MFSPAPGESCKPLLLVNAAGSALSPPSCSVPQAADQQWLSWWGSRPQCGTAARAAQRPPCPTRRRLGMGGSGKPNHSFTEASGYAQTSGSADVMQKNLPSNEKPPPRPTMLRTTAGNPGTPLCQGAQRELGLGFPVRAQRAPHTVLEPR